MKHHRVLRIVSKLLIPFIMLFALYVQFHGDFGPARRDVVIGTVRDGPVEEACGKHGDLLPETIAERSEPAHKI